MTEQEALAQAIGQQQASNDTALVFNAADRGQMLIHFTGLAMQATITTNNFGYNRPSADEAVRMANETILAIERFYTLAATRTRGNG